MGEEREFKTLLQEERGKQHKSITVQGVDKAWWKKEISHWASCPHMEKTVCVPSKRLRPGGPFVCTGSWHQTCQIYLLLKNNNEDPMVLINEG
jgi:hypothetical protein